MKNFYRGVFSTIPYALLWVWMANQDHEVGIGPYTLLVMLLLYTDLMNYYQGHKRGFDKAAEIGAALLMDVLTKLKPTIEQMKRLEGTTGDGALQVRVEDVTDAKQD